MTPLPLYPFITCPTSAPTSFDVPGGKVWISEAYAILDEVEFKREPSTTGDVEVGPFALDLTDTDDNVGEAINVNVPAGSYTGVKFRVKRIEDEAMLIFNVTDPAAFRNKVLDNSRKRRPSIYIAGTIEVTGGSCKPFIFVTDHRWEVIIPFTSTATESNPVDAVILFDLAGAFNASGATAQGLSDEVGQGQATLDDEWMGLEYLDGRTKDPNHGTPLAEALTAQIPINMEVFVQSAGAIDGNPTGTTVIDDSATRVSGDDNPSVSDLTETAG